LPSGILSVDLTFDAGDAIDLISDVNNRKFAKGVCLYSSHDLTRIKGKQSVDIKSILGRLPAEVIIHRDDLVIL